MNLDRLSSKQSIKQLIFFDRIEIIAHKKMWSKKNFLKFNLIDDFKTKYWDDTNKLFFLYCKA